MPAGGRAKAILVLGIMAVPGCAALPSANGEEEGRAALRRKAVVEKREPNELVAADGTWCAADRERFEAIRVGEAIWCVWIRGPAEVGRPRRDAGYPRGAEARRSCAPAALSAQRARYPGPRTARPGLAPVWMPSRTTGTPFTSTCSTPTESWCGSSKVARSPMVAGSNTTMSA